MKEQIHTHPYDLDAARAFIAALTGSADSDVTFQTYRDGGWGGGGDGEVFHGRVADVWPRICDAQERGYAVCVMANEGDLKGRRTANVVALRALFADDDDGTVTPAMLAHLRPSIVVSSGHGMHYYWRLRTGEPLDAFTPAQKAIAARLGTDRSVNDLARVLRLPGTFNLKDRSNPRPVEAVETAATTYSIDEVLRGLRATAVVEDAPSAAAPVARPATRLLSPVSAEARARAYITAIHATEGQGGNNATFRAAAALRKDFALDEAAAWPILRAWNTTNAHPAWEERQLREIFDHAGKHGSHVAGAALAACSAAKDAMEVDGEARATLIRSCVRRLTPAILDQAPPAKEFLWEGAIPVGDVGVFVGPGAAGKSATMVGLAVHMALGRPFLGRATQRRRTVIVSLEDNFDDYRRKLAAWREALGELWDSVQVADYVSLLDLRGTNIRLVRPAGRGEYAPSIDGRALASEITAAVPDVGLVIIETVSRVGGDESNPAMSALVSACEEISARTGASVVVVGHVSKNEAREGRGDQHAQRGGAALSDNGRFALTATLLNSSGNDKDPDARPPGIDPAERGRMFLLRVAKVNCAPTSTIGIVERVPSSYQTVTVALRAAGGAGASVSGSERLLRLRDLVATLAGDGDVTKTTLEEDRLKEVNAIGITKREVEGLLDDAVAAGLLMRERRKGKGGGVRYLPAPVVGGDE